MTPLAYSVVDEELASSFVAGLDLILSHDRCLQGMYVYARAKMVQEVNYTINDRPVCEWVTASSK